MKNLTQFMAMAGRFRSEVQVGLAALTSVESSSVEAGESLERFVAQVKAARGYDVVGRLLPSAIYDGERLPLMYRVVSVDAEGGRTVAYLIGDDGDELAARTGEIVGVRGEGGAERSWRVPVIRVTAIETLRSE